MATRRILRWVAKYLIVNKDPYELIDSSEKKYLFLYKLGTQLLIDKKFPIQINIESSGTCNFSCPFCARSNSSAKNGINSDTSILTNIVNEAKKHGPTVFAFHIWGEPLANPNWYQMVHIIKKANPRNGITITTNGSLLNVKNISSLKEDKVDQLVISLHTLDPEIYSKRIGVSFKLEKTLENIFKLGEATKNTKMVKLIRLFETKDELIERKELYKKLKDYGYSIEITKYDNSAGYKDKWSEVPKKKRYPCYHPWLTASININGDTTICCVDPENKLKIGNVKENTLEKLWQGQILKRIRNKHKNSDFTENCLICNKCDTWATMPDIFFNYQKNNR